MHYSSKKLLQQSVVLIKKKKDVGDTIYVGSTNDFSSLK